MSRVKLKQQQIASHTTQRPSTVLVTGCTSGIGKSLVIEFARLGYNIIGCGRRIKNLREVEAAVKLNNPNGKHFFYQCDVGSYKSVCEFKENVNSTGLKIDICKALEAATWKRDARRRSAIKGQLHCWSTNICTTPMRQAGVQTCRPKLQMTYSKDKCQ